MSNMHNSPSQITVDVFHQSKSNGHKISMLSAYDYTSACIIKNTDIDCILVGDSAAMLMAGFSSTTLGNIDMIAYHTAAVARGAPNKFIISDMPFLSTRKGQHHALSTVEKFIQAGANAVKIEGVEGHEDIIKNITTADIPVIGHIGLTPMSVNALGGYKVQGKNQAQATRIIEQAKALEDLGCVAIVIECVPSILAKEITDSINIPTIGIGAGPYVNGQVMVMHDILGLTDFPNDKKPKFIKQYIDGKSIYKQAFDQFNTDIQNNSYPSDEHTY